MIANLQNTRTVDPHGFNNIVIKCLRFVLAKPLSMNFRYIFSTGTIPDAWHTADITPVHKKGVSSHVTNYRPISLTSLFCKIFERIVKHQMLNYLQSCELITQQQYSFLSKSSTSAQLLDCINDWTLSL